MFLNEQLLISKVLLSYCKKEKYADEEFILKILKIIISSRKNKEYVKNIEIGKEIQNGGVAYYDFFNKELLVTLTPQKKDVYEYNLKILYFILHELEHVEQYKISRNSDNSMKKTLLSESLFPNLLKEKIQNFDFKHATPEETFKLSAQIEYATIRGEMYSKLYEFLPAERMAEIDSFKYILDIIDRCKCDGIKEQKEEYEKGYAIRELMGYREKNGIIECPTYTFYSQINNINNNEELFEKIISALDKNSKSMSLEERLYHGLPIDSKEYVYTLGKII